ncbi:neprilysin-1-like [Amphiura filiformis]|uniref:neprilysin-1-like n=1 Tax=Amphiura filiformis TaxID=82378 RepID=UPI003B21A39C
MEEVTVTAKAIYFKQPSWYQRKTRLERCLILISLVLTFVSLTLLMVLIAELTSKEEIQIGSLLENQDVCLTPGCVEAANEILTNMDPTVDPCEDFYEYACGGWKKRTVIPDDQPRFGIFSELVDKLQIECKKLIESPISEVDSDAVVKAKNFYFACMDEERINNIHLKPIQLLIQRLGGWPVLNDGEYDEDTWVLEEILAKIRIETNSNFLFFHAVNVDAKNSDAHIITIDQPLLGMSSRDYFLQDITDKNLNAYYSYMVDITSEFNDRSAEDIEKEIADVLDFERQVANITVPEMLRMNTTLLYNRMSISHLQTTVTQFDWLRYFNLIMKSIDNPIGEEEEILSFSPVYVTAMGDLLAKTPKRILANFFMWRVVDNTVSQLDNKLRTIRQEFYKVMSGEGVQPPRWKQCIDKTEMYLGQALGAMFIDEYFDEQSKSMAKEMIGDIRQALIEVLHGTEWMDESTRQIALEKARAVREHIGYDDNIKNITALNEKYKKVNISRETHFENVLSIWKNHALESMAKLRQPVDKYSWSSSPVTVNAYYQFTSNTITFPAGILQPPFYNRRSPRSRNYGGIGVVIGHELTHGFDDRGRLFDKDGNLDQWWTSTSENAFIEKQQCLMDQYSNFTVDQIGINLNGVHTRGENIADNGGINEAFKAYRRWVERNGREEPRLPGLNLTHNQIFFVNFGQIWCGLNRDEDLMYLVMVDTHPPSKYRVLGTVSNSYDFSEAFQCRPGSAMNPVKKCTVW